MNQKVIGYKWLPLRQSKYQVFLGFPRVLVKRFQRQIKRKLVSPSVSQASQGAFYEADKLAQAISKAFPFM